MSVAVRGRKPELVASGRIYQQGVESPAGKRLDLYLPHAIFDRLQGMARSEGLSMSGLVRGLVCDGLAARQNGSGGPA